MGYGMNNNSTDGMSRSARITYAIKESGKMQIEIAKACAVAPASVSQWRSGETKGIRPENLFALASATGFDAKWLATGEGEPRVGNLEAERIIAWDAPDDLPSDEFVIVPRVDVKFAAGSGEMVVDEVYKTQGVAFRMGWIRQRGLNPKCLYAFELKGDSMEPTLPHGSMITINTECREIEDGKVYGIRYGDDLRIKRLFKRFDGGLIIRSDNAAKYPEEQIPVAEAEQIAIIGRYVAHSYDGDI